MRIDKYICDTINITRSQVRRKISGGCVYVGGVQVRSPAEQVDENTCTVTVDGRELKYNKYVYIMMNKPKGVLSATADKHLTTAVDLLEEEDKRSDLFIAGRLDKDTTGFLLITNDGDFAHNLLSPKKHVYKTYAVLLAHDNFTGYTDAFNSGVTLDDGYVCKPAEFVPLGDCRCRLRIREGKFHQIKRMFRALGNEVVELKRIAIDNVVLDEKLKSGEYRYLNEQEFEIFMNKINKKYPQKI